MVKTKKQLEDEKDLIAEKDAQLKLLGKRLEQCLDELDKIYSENIALKQQIYILENLTKNVENLEASSPQAAPIPTPQPAATTNANDNEKEKYQVLILSEFTLMSELTVQPTHNFVQK